MDDGLNSLRQAVQDLIGAGAQISITMHVSGDTPSSFATISGEQLKTAEFVSDTSAFDRQTEVLSGLLREILHRLDGRPALAAAAEPGAARPGDEAPFVQAEPEHVFTCKFAPNEPVKWMNQGISYGGRIEHVSFFPDGEPGYSIMADHVARENGAPDRIFIVEHELRKI